MIELICIFLILGILLIFLVVSSKRTSSLRSLKSEVRDIIHNPDASKFLNSLEKLIKRYNGKG